MTKLFVCQVPAVEEQVTTKGRRANSVRHARRVEVGVHSFFYKNVVFRPRLNILIFVSILG